MDGWIATYHEKERGWMDDSYLLSNFIAFPIHTVGCSTLLFYINVYIYMLLWKQTKHE